MAALRRKIRSRFGRWNSCYRCGGQGVLWLIVEVECQRCKGEGRTRG